MLVQGTTVSAIGPYKGLQHVRKIVEDTMKNIHPVYNIKALMIKRELAKDPQLKNENWARFLPHYKPKTLSKRKKPKIIKEKKEYTPFPPPQLESKIDKQLASGEYFLQEEQRKTLKLKEKAESKVHAEVKRQERRNAPFVPPEEPIVTRKETKSKQDNDVDIEQLKKKVKYSTFKSHDVSSSDTNKSKAKTRARAK